MKKHYKRDFDDISMDNAVKFMAREISEIKSNLEL